MQKNNLRTKIRDISREDISDKSLAAVRGGRRSFQGLNEGTCRETGTVWNNICTRDYIAD